MDLNVITTTVITAVIGAITNWSLKTFYEQLKGVRKDFWWKNKNLPLTLVNRHFDINTLKRRLRLLVIDDEDVFPLQLFRDNGYNIERWEKVKDYRSLENGDYDIIILDILNVATELSDEDGFGVLESLKKHNPSQIVIAYSAHSFDFSKQKFWELADAKINKPSLFLKIKETVDNTITECFTLERYVKVLHQFLYNINLSEKKIALIDKEVIKAMKGKREPDWNKIINIIDNRPVFNTVKSIISTIIKNFKLDG